jgi:hypothetical protein
MNNNIDQTGNPILDEMRRNMQENTRSNNGPSDTPNSIGLPKTKNDLWEQTYGKYFNVNQASIGDVPDDIGEFTRLGVQYNPYQPKYSYEDRALNQGFGEQFANAGKRFAASTVVETINTAGGIFDIPDYVNSDNEVGNFVTEWAEQQRSNIDKWAPIYIRESKNGMNNYAWWLKNGADLAASVTSFGITGGILGRGLSSIKWLNYLTKGTKAAKRGKDAASLAMDAQIGAKSKALSAETIDAIAKGQRISNTMLTSTALNQAESLSSATQVYSDVYEDALRKGLNDEKAREIASSAASSTMNVNRANILLNMTSANRFLKTPDAVRSGLRVQSNRLKDIAKFRDASGKKVDNIWRDLASESTQESLEEIINVYSETRGKEYAKTLFDNVDDVRIRHLKGIFDPLRVDKLAQTAATKEGIEAAVLGAIGGAGQTGIQGAIDQYGSGKLLGEQVTQLDSEGNIVRKKEDLLYQKDTPYDIGEEVFENIKNEKGETIIEAGTIIDEEVVAKHGEFLFHKKGDKVRDLKGEVIQKETTPELVGDGKFFSKNKAKNIRAEQYQSIKDKMKNIAEQNIVIEERANFQQKQYAAMEAVDNILDPQISNQLNDEYVDILSRWKIDNDGNNVDYDSDNGKKLLNETKNEIAEYGFDELQDLKSKAKSKLIQEQAWQSFSNNSSESLKAIYRDIMDLDPQTAKEKGYSDDYKQQAESVINQINQLYNYYREYTAKYNPERAKALYNLSARNLHNSKLIEQARAERQNLISENAMQNEESEDYLTSLEGLTKLEKINKDEENELKPLLNEIDKINNKISVIQNRGLSIETKDSAPSNRELTAKVAESEAEKTRQLADLKKEYLQKQSQIDKVRQKYADKRVNDKLASRADIYKLVDLGKRIQNLESEIENNNKEFTRIRDRKKDPRNKSIIISESKRQKEAFRVLAKRMYNLQQKGEHVITYNPNKKLSNLEKFISSVFSRLSKVIEESDKAGIKGKLDQAINEYVNILNDDEVKEFESNKDIIRSEVIDRVNKMNDTSLTYLNQLSELGFTGVLQPTNSEYEWEFIPNKEQIIYVDDSEIDYYRNLKSETSGENIYQEEEVSEGLYRLTLNNPNESITITEKEMPRLNIVTKEQADIKNQVDKQISFSKNRLARINALEQQKVKTLKFIESVSDKTNKQLYELEIDNLSEEEIQAYKDLVNQIDNSFDSLSEMYVSTLTDINNIRRFREQITGIDNLLSETESQQLINEINTLQKIVNVKNDALNKLSYASDFIENYSNLLLNINKPLNQVLTDKNIRKLYEGEDISKWQKTKQLEDLPSDVFQKVYDLFSDENLNSISDYVDLSDFYKDESQEGTSLVNLDISDIYNKLNAALFVFENQNIDESVIIDILKKAYSDIDNLIELEESLLDDAEETDEAFERQSSSQRGLNPLDSNSEDDDLDVVDESDEDAEILFKRVGDDAETAMKRFNIITDAGAHVEYTITDVNGKPVYDTKHDENGMPVFVKNPMMLSWKTTLSRLQKGLITDQNGNTIDASNTSVKYLLANDPEVANVKATSNNIFANSKIELESRGLSVNSDSEIYVSNKQKYNTFVKTYTTEMISNFPEEAKKQIENINTDETLSIGDLDLLFRYTYDKFGSERISGDKAPQVVKGPGIYITITDKTGNPYFFNLNDNKASTEQGSGYVQVFSTLNTPYSSEKIQFKNQLANYLSKELGLTFNMSFDELVEFLQETRNTQNPENIHLSVTDINGDLIKFTLDDVNKLEDTLWSKDNLHPIQKTIKELIERDIDNYRNFRMATISNLNKGQSVLENDYQISNGHPLFSKEYRPFNVVFEEDDIIEVKINTNKKAGVEKVTSAYGAPLSFDSEGYSPSVVTKTGQISVLTNSRDHIPVVSRKINDEEANLLKDLIINDFGVYVDKIDSKFKTSNIIKDENGNDVNLPPQSLIRYENKKNISVNELPIVSKIVFFSGKKHDAKNRKDWDISIEKANRKSYGTKNYLHYGKDYKVSISKFKNNKEEQDKFVEWAKNNMTHIVNNKMLQQNSDSEYYHPISIEQDKTSGEFITVVRKYDNYLKFLHENNVLKTKAISPSESEAIGGLGEINVGKYVILSSEVKEYPKQLDPAKEPEDVGTEENEDEQTLTVNSNINDLSIGSEYTLKIEIDKSEGLGGGKWEIETIGTVINEQLATVINDQLKEVNYKYLEFSKENTILYDINQKGQSSINEEQKNIVFDLILGSYSNNEAIIKNVSETPGEALAITNYIHQSQEGTVSVQKMMDYGLLLQAGTQWSTIISDLKISEISKHVNSELIDVDDTLDVDVDNEDGENTEPESLKVSDLAQDISLAKSKIALLNGLSTNWESIELINNPSYNGYMMYFNNQIIVGNKYDSLSNAKKGDILLHEIVHHETVRTIAKYKNKPSGTPANISDALDSIKDVRGELINYLIENNIISDEKMPKLWIIALGPDIRKNLNGLNITVEALKNKQKKGRKIDLDMFIAEYKNISGDEKLVKSLETSIEEFVASIFEDENIIKILNDIEIDSDVKGIKTLYDKIINLLRTMLDLEIKDNSALKKALSSAITLAKEDTSISPNYELKETDSNIVSDPIVVDKGTEEPIDKIDSDELSADDIGDLFGDSDTDPSIDAPDYEGYEYPVEDNYNENSISKRIGNKLSEVKLILEKNINNTEELVNRIPELFNYLKRDYLNFKTDILLNTVGDSNINSSNIDFLIAKEIQEYVEHPKDEDFISKFDDLLNPIFDDLKQLMSEDTYVNAKVSKSSTIIKNNLKLSSMDRSFQVTKTLSMSPLEKLDFYEGLSYFIFKDIVSNNIDLDNINKKEINKIYKKVLVTASRHVIDYADKLMPSIKPEKRDLLINKKSVAESIIQGISSNFADKKGITRKKYKEIIKDHFDNVMISYGFSQNLEYKEETISEILPDYVSSYEIDPKLMMPALIKIMIASVPKVNVKETNVDSNKLQKFRKLKDLLTDAKERIDSGKKFSTNELAIIAQVGEQFNISQSKRLKSLKDGNLNPFQKTLLIDIVNSSLPQIQQILDTGTTVSTVIKKNSMLLPTLDNFGRVWNYLSRQVSNTIPTHEDMMYKLRSVIEDEKRKKVNKGFTWYR